MTTPGDTAPLGPDAEITLTWIRDYPGLVAYAPVPASGRYPRDNRQRPRPKTARLRSSDPDPHPRRPDGLVSDGEWSWIIRSEHTWEEFAERFKGNAHAIAIALAQAGCITIGHDLEGNALVQPPRRVYPHPALSAAAKARNHQYRDDCAALQAEAAGLTAAVADEWPDAARALRATDNPQRLVWAVRAARDLTDGQVHDSVRAFVQVHAGHTKARDGVHHLLAELGFEHDTLATLGLTRNPYIGLGGPIHLHVNGGVIDLTLMPGPHDVRLVPEHGARLHLPTAADILLIIENRQAAESVCDLHPELPVIWCHGQPPGDVLTLITQAAEQTPQTLICTDADLGGVYITARIYDHLPSSTTARIIDVGAINHDHGRTFNAHSRTRLQRLSTREDPIGDFAKSCLDRGYAIEQESSARASLRDALQALQTEGRHPRVRRQPHHAHAPIPSPARPSPSEGG